MRELDLLVKYISDKLKNNSDLSKRLNIILTADHGHAEVFRIIFLFFSFLSFINLYMNTFYFNYLIN